MTDETVTSTPDAPAPAPEASKRQMSFTILDNGTIQAEFGEGIEPLQLNPSAVPEAVYASAVTEGLISRARGYTSKLVDKDRTPDALRAAVEKAFANLTAGIWKIERAPGSSTEFSIEVEAAFLFRSKRAEKVVAAALAKGESAPDVQIGTLADAAENFAKLTDEQKKTLKALPLYQLSYAEVKAKRDAEKMAKLAAKVAAEDGENSPF